MLCTGSRQLGGVQSLADVVGGGSEENGLRVDAQIEVACSDPFEELPCNDVDCSQMGDQARRTLPFAALGIVVLVMAIQVIRSALARRAAMRLSPAPGEPMS